MLKKLFMTIYLIEPKMNQDEHRLKDLLSGNILVSSDGDMMKKSEKKLNIFERSRKAIFLI